MNEKIDKINPQLLYQTQMQIEKDENNQCLEAILYVADFEAADASKANLLPFFLVKELIDAISFVQLQNNKNGATRFAAPFF